MGNESTTVSPAKIEGYSGILLKTSNHYVVKYTHEHKMSKIYFYCSELKAELISDSNHKI
jgi:hypothetical protein